MHPDMNIKKIMAIHRRCDEVPFRMALQHLFDAGQRNFTEETVAVTKDTIQETTPKNAVLTADYQSELVDIAYELSKFPTWDILLYIKLYVSIPNDDLVKLAAAEQALSTWNSLTAPKAWREVLADPDMRTDILRVMIKNHSPGYTISEIKEAIRYVAEEN